MDKLLSLEEAAEILGVEYKTVYRLVRAGKISAGKVGRVYRIKREDLDAYFESSKQRIAAKTRRDLIPLENLRCCVTGQRIVSHLDIGGYAADTGEPICKSAWGAGARTTAPVNNSLNRGEPQ
jgi:excisionase family DNA binding protein